MGILGGETRRQYAERQKGTVRIEMVLVPSSPDIEWELGSLCVNPDRRAGLEEMLGSYGIARAFVFVEEAMNGLIVTASHFQRFGSGEKGAQLYMNYATPAHGVFLNIHDAMVMGTKDATCLMAYGDDKCAAVQEATSVRDSIDEIPIIGKLAMEIERSAAHIGKMALCGFFGTPQKKGPTLTQGRKHRFSAVAYEKMIKPIQADVNHLVIAHRIA